MENLIEKILCIEVLEKMHRMKRYLYSHYSSSKTEGKEVVGLFENSLSATEEAVGQIIKYINDHNNLIPVERAVVSREISNAFFTIVNLHEQLQLIYGSWVRPETYTFINEILEFLPAGRKQEKVNIILSNDYMFSEGDLTWIFSTILRKYKIKNNFIEENPTVFLPKIDYENPLNWTILAHECGHADLKGIENIKNNKLLKELLDELDENDKETLESWIEEIYCDLLATKILGPAYLTSFCTFALLSSGLEGNEEGNDSHPSNVLRINLIQEYLESKNIKLPINKTFKGHSDLSSYYYYMVESYNEISRKHLNPFVFTKSRSIDTTLLLDLISEEVDELVQLNHTLTNEDYKRIDFLKERLSDGIIIASYQDIDKLKKARKKFNSNQEIDLIDLRKGKEALQETRARLWEIINTGWINKVENILPNCIDLFFNNERLSFKEKLEILGKDLEKYDSLLLKSIESSEIFKIMEK